MTQMGVGWGAGFQDLTAPSPWVCALSQAGPPTQTQLHSGGGREGWPGPSHFPHCRWLLRVLSSAHSRG